MAKGLRATLIFAVLALAGCGSGAAGSSGAGTTVVEAAAVTPAAASGPDSARVPAARSAHPPSPPTTIALEVPPASHPVIWVRSGRRVALRTEPAGGELVGRAGRRTEFGSPTVFGVIETDHGWAGVTTPLLANNRLAWVKLDPKRLDAGWTRLSIAVDLSDRSARLLRGDRVVREFGVTVGAPTSPTPIGRFSVTDTFRGSLDASAYGCCALALSATQPNLPSGWLGGRRIAIHGGGSALGQAASHGCVRAADRQVSRLVDEVPLGAPVVIRE